MDPICASFFFLRADEYLRQDDATNDFTRALILVPTKELAEQVTSFLKKVVHYCDKDVIAINVASGTTAHLQR